MNKNSLLIIFLLLCLNSLSQSNISHYIFTSDVHFGLEKKNFRGKTNVTAYEVNKAMIDAMNTIAKTSLPNDKGVAANTEVKFVDAFIITGDIANRHEKEVSPVVDKFTSL